MGEEFSFSFTPGEDLPKKLKTKKSKNQQKQEDNSKKYKKHDLYETGARVS